MFPDPSGIDDDAEGMTFLEHLFECAFESEQEFVDAAVGAYTHFLVIKALETLARDRLIQTSPEDPPAPRALIESEFLQGGQPSTKVIDLMWHAHGLSPGYAAAGVSLVGTIGIAGHDSVYHNHAAADHASKLLPKLRQVYKYEMRHLVCKTYDPGCEATYEEEGYDEEGYDANGSCYAPGWIDLIDPARLNMLLGRGYVHGSRLRRAW